MTTTSVPLNFERTRQLYESNVPLPLAAPSSSHLPGQDLACTAAIGLNLSNLLAWGWVILMLCIHIMNIHYITWITYMNMSGYDMITCSCVFMYISINVCSYLSLCICSLHRAKEKVYTVIYSAFRWIIEFNGTTKRLSRDLCTPLNSSGFHWFIPC